MLVSAFLGRMGGWSLGIGVLHVLVNEEGEGFGRRHGTAASWE